MKSFAAIIALGVGLAVVSSASANTEIESFDNFSLDAIYASWGAPFATLTSGATGFEVQSTYYGSGYKYLGGDIDASAEDTVQADVTVTGGIAGFVIDINDENNNGQQYAWYGLVPGGGIGGGDEYILTMPVASGTYFDGTGVLDKSIISQINIGIDPGTSTDPYDVTFNDLSLVTVPEPAGLGVAAVVSLLAARRRRS